MPPTARSAPFLTRLAWLIGRHTRYHHLGTQCPVRLNLICMAREFGALWLGFCSIRMFPCQGWAATLDEHLQGLEHVIQVISCASISVPVPMPLPPSSISSLHHLAYAISTHRNIRSGQGLISIQLLRLTSVISHDLAIQDSIVHPQAKTSSSYEEQECSVCPVARWISFLRFICLVDPYTCNLPRSADGNIDSYR